MNVQFLIFKSLHIIEYGFLYVLWYRALRNTTHYKTKTIMCISFVIAILYAFTDELHQQFVPTREGRLRDVGIDTLGVCISIFTVWKLLPKAPQKLLNLAKSWQLL